jgi:repressor LexA
MSFSELLKQCRKKQGISQAELASKLGVTQQAVGKWESGKSSPDPSTVARIAELLNTTADYLLGLYRPVRLSEVEAEQKEILKIVRRLADEGQIVLGGAGGEQMV